MTKFVSAALFAAAAIGAPVLADPVTTPIAFERDGVHYVGTVTGRDDGSSLIAGHEIESGHAFQLTIAKGMVNGTYDNQPVSYDVPRADRAKPAPRARM